jgi:hypothetical protein
MCVRSRGIGTAVERARVRLDGQLPTTELKEVGKAVGATVVPEVLRAHRGTRMRASETRKVRWPE